MKGVVFDIKRFAVHDGPGIRTTIFFKGCPLRCSWCHNPESQAVEPREVRTGKGLKTSTAMAAGTEIIGREVSLEEVMKEIEKETIFYDESGGGVTFSGGEPLMQPKFLSALLEECRRCGIRTTLDTSGFAPSEILVPLMDSVDLFLYDLKIMNDSDHIKYTGVSNRLILKNLDILIEHGKNVVVRFPVVPGITDTADNIRQIALKLTALDTIERLDLLPFHCGGGGKYERLKMEDAMKDVEPPSDDYLGRIKDEFESYGLNVRLGG